MEFTDLLDEYLDLKRRYDADELSERGYERYHEIRDEINRRVRGEP